MKPLILSLLFLVSLTAYSQYSIGDYYQTFNDPTRSRNVPIHIYYPATSSGTNAPSAVGSFPVISFGHGFIISYTQYQWIADALVPLGYILAFPDTETGISPDHQDFGLDLAYSLEAIVAEGLVSSSPIYNIVGSTSAIGGHSMGGGASFLGADGNSGPTALFNFSAAETNPSAISAASNISIPSLIIEGSDDCVTPSAGNTLAMYNALSSSCKSLYSINGGSHCKFANSDFICGFGEIGCGGSLSLANQETFTLDVLIPFLDFHLKQNCFQGGTLASIIAQPSPNNISSICNYASVPVVTINNLASVITNQNPVSLSGNPVGGAFSGIGMIGNVFNPSIAGNGLHTITYTTNVNGCDVEESQSVFVININFNFVTYESTTISP